MNNMAAPHSTPLFPVFTKNGQLCAISGALPEKSVGIPLKFRQLGFNYPPLIPQLDNLLKPKLGNFYVQLDNTFSRVPDENRNQELHF